ncbi:MarR family transcriptional regulator [Streptomyces sp. NBS 14/10]|uniref:MarR family winged helix-turn-helix transcriptional regulator n=1 Tax=Streptomyces sp. NBS 14/10 TaxID=1945643 RepID=UPI000B7E789B|nr:MarR family transcriptional regulator [Streptomyces sp. NBS 14/10]KAK1182134.1 MarR family transcriptional regulator [Streptomyces sp. NBS 14/10]NUP42066.1 MarR family transcriptional regulator [Streptomyces sp.]NUS81406.1 MarR family transcriptional regulator [Streptomyces sp.]
MPEFLDLHSKTSKTLRALAERGMREHGLHLGQNHLLAALWEHDGRTPGEIASALHVTTPTVTKMATRMAATGLLTRRPDDRDSRLVRLWLTDAGRALQQPVEQERRRMEEAVTADLTDAERQHLLSALTKVHRAASDLLDTPGPRENGSITT